MTPRHTIPFLRIHHTPPAADGLIGYCAWLEPPPGKGPIRLVVGYRLARCVTPALLAALWDGLELARRESWRLVELAAPEWSPHVWPTGYAPVMEEGII